MKTKLLSMILFITFFALIKAGTADAKSFGEGKVISVQPVKANLELSGIIKTPTGYYFVSDDGKDHYLYEGTSGPDGIEVKKVLDLESSASGKKYKETFKNHKELKEKNRRWDLEGIAQCGSVFYLANERVREVFKLAGNKIIPLKINFRAAFSRFDEGGANAGFEGIAVDCKNQIMYVAKEREPRQIFVINLKNLKISKIFDFHGSNRQGQLVIDPFTANGLLAIGPDIADMHFYNGFLYVLERNTYEVTKIDPNTFNVVGRMSYYFASRPLYEKIEPFGLAEALAISDDRIYIGLDNNLTELSGYAKKQYGISGTTGVLITIERPKGF